MCSLVLLTITFFLCTSFLFSEAHTRCSKDIFQIQPPQFQIISAAKTGSTSLYSYLCQHSSVECLAKKKELNLLRNKLYRIKTDQEKSKVLKWYLKEGFGLESKVLHNEFLTFEASIHYYHHKIALENLSILLPCSKLIWMLRNPLPRAVSEYLHQAVKVENYPSFQVLIQAELQALEACSSHHSDFNRGFENKLFACLAKHKLKKYLISTAFYAYFIHAWSAKFPIEQQLFLDYEFFRKNPEGAIQKIHKFLNISTEVISSSVWKFNKADTRNGKAEILRRSVSIPRKMQKKLETHISYQTKELYQVIGQDFGWSLLSLD